MEEDNNLDPREFNNDFPDDDLVDEQDEVSLDDDAMELNVGAEYESIESLQEVYRKYAKSKGFQIRRRNSRKDMVQFVCYRQGDAKPHRKTTNIENEAGADQRQRYTKTCKIGCLACLYCSFDSKSNIWRVTKFLDEHNHEFVSPKSLKFLRTHKNIPTSARRLSHVFNDQCIGVGKVTNVLNLNLEDSEFTRKDCYNYMMKFRKQLLDHGDAQSVHCWCIRQQQLDQNFRYAIEVDEADRMRNFFWIDARSRCAYELFGDVVSFDTTYRINKYSMPFAPFVGIDNHMHTILFGCALLQDETEDTFVWLFNVWLNAVNGKAPSAFITD